MVRHPLKGRVGIEHVGIGGRRPLRQVRLHEFASGQPLARLPQHVGRGIDADDVRVRKTLDQQLRRIAGPAAEIEDLARARRAGPARADRAPGACADPRISDIAWRSSRPSGDYQCLTIPDGVIRSLSSRRLSEPGCRRVHRAARKMWRRARNPGDKTLRLCFNVSGQHRGVHMKKAAIVTAVIVGMAFSAPPASAQVCMAGIIFAAFYANATANRELTATEAVDLRPLLRCRRRCQQGRQRRQERQRQERRSKRRSRRKTAARAKPQ